MFFLERLVFQGTEKCPQYMWKQFAMSKNKPLLEKIRRMQRRPEDWRITTNIDERENKGVA